MDRTDAVCPSFPSERPFHLHRLERAALRGRWFRLCRQAQWRQPQGEPGSCPDPPPPPPLRWGGLLLAGPGVDGVERHGEQNNSQEEASTPISPFSYTRSGIPQLKPSAQTANAPVSQGTPRNGPAVPSEGSAACLPGWRGARDGAEPPTHSDPIKRRDTRGRQKLLEEPRAAQRERTAASGRS